MTTILCIIPHYGKDEDLINCVNSIDQIKNRINLEAKLNIELEVVIYLNKSIASLNIDKVGNNVSYIQDERNVNIGFTNAINQAIIQDYFLFDFVWILNNDTSIPNVDTFLNAIKLFESNENIGIVGSQTRDINNTNFIHHGGTTQMFPNGLHKTGLVSENQLQEDTIEKWVSFCSVFISKKCLIYTGLLDGNLFNFYSDSDYCLRARLQGFEVWHCHNSVVFHEIGQSANPNAEQRKQMALDFEYFNRKWFGSKIFKDLTQGI